MNNRICKNDEISIFANEDKKIPYLYLELDFKDAMLLDDLKSKKLRLYTPDGKPSCEVRDYKGNTTDKRAVFIAFLDEE